MVPFRVLSRTNLSYSPDTPALNPCVSEICGLFNSLCALFATPVVCFQQLAASFCRTRGVGVPSQVSPLESTPSSLFSPLQLQLLQLEHQAKDAHPEPPSGVEGSQS